MKQPSCPMIALFAETHSSLPDSKAAANVIEVLDKYLGLDVDSKPLLKQAEVFEAKLKTLMQQTAGSKEQQERKALSYIS
jgi:predicted ATP-grasp superfamily ATP-dependent carboligase